MAKKEEKTAKIKNKENKVKKHFFKDFKAELKKVIWPSPKQLVNNTVAVITIVIITSVIIFVLDAAFDIANKYGIAKLQSYVVEKFKPEDHSEEEHKHEHSETESEHNHSETENSNTAEGSTDKGEEENSAESNQ